MPHVPEGGWGPMPHINTAIHAIHPKHGTSHVVTGFLTHHPNGHKTFEVDNLAKVDDHSTLKAHDLYHHLMKHHKMAIMSSDTQSEGGQKVWKSLAKKKDVHVHGWHDEHPVNLNPKDPHETHVPQHHNDYMFWDKHDNDENEPEHTIAHTKLVAHIKEQLRAKRADSYSLTEETDPNTCVVHSVSHATGVHYDTVMQHAKAHWTPEHGIGYNKVHTHILPALGYKSKPFHSKPTKEKVFYPRTVGRLKQIADKNKSYLITMRGAIDPDSKRQAGHMMAIHQGRFLNPGNTNLKNYTLDSVHEIEKS
jgi:hypothetical protein